MANLCCNRKSHVRHLQIIWYFRTERWVAQSTRNLRIARCIVDTSQRPDTEHATRTATIRIDRGFAVVDAAYAPLLCPDLSYEQIQFRHEQNNRVNSRLVRRNVYEYCDDGTLCTSEGCVERVARRLQQEGIKVEIEDSSPISTADACGPTDELWSLDPRLPVVREVVSVRRMGVLEVPRGRQRARFAAGLCGIFPRSKVFVACATRKIAKELADALAELLGCEVDAVHQREWHFRSRVVCGTFASFDSSSACDWDIVLFEDAEAGAGKLLWENLASYGMNRKRRYAFSSDRSLWAAADNLRCDVAFGPTIFRAGRSNREGCHQIKVVFATGPLCGERRETSRRDSRRRPTSRDAAERAVGTRQRRESLWRNESRNNTITEIADGFATGRSDAIWQAGLFLDQADPFQGIPDSPRVAVLVETVEHATRLSRSLPGWTVCVVRPREIDLSQPQQAANGYRLPERAIVTVVRAERYHHFDADVLIMAIGGSQTYLPRGLSHRWKNILVVDLVDDEGSPEADSQQRRHRYLAIGCQVQDRPTERIRQQRDSQRSPVTTRQNT